MENIRDWCISRQIWWGHRIPAWECADCGEYTVKRETPELCSHCGSPNIAQVEDVLDTWFSSALWPFSTLGWPRRTKALEVFYPTSLLITGFDILFFWVARMIMMGLHFMGDVPFREVYIHALVRDAEGQKMSKTKGNVIDPLDMIDKYGADALRFTLAAMASPGRDIPLAEDRIAGYRRFGNKIWNAVRFALMNLEDFDPSKPEPKRSERSIFDRWILSRLSRVARAAKDQLDAYRFDEAANAIYRFWWGELCDWYLELIKPTLYKPASPAARLAAQHTLYRVMDGALRLLHPFMPFLAEELWHRLPGVEGSLMRASFVLIDDMDDDEAESDVSFIVDLISAIRSARVDLGIAPGMKLSVSVRAGGRNLSLVESATREICALARLDSVECGESLERPGGSISREIEGAAIYIPVAGLVDVSARLNKLKKELDKAKSSLKAAESRLADERFLSSAPEEVVVRTKRQRADAETRIGKLKALIGELESLT